MHRIYASLIAVLLLTALPPSHIVALDPTTPLKNINTTTIDMFESGDPNTGLDLVGNSTHAFFTYKDLANGGELWTSDGTPAGTELLYDTNPGSGSATISSLLMIGSKLFFFSNGLWVSDGSSAGTHPIVITDTTGLYPHVLNLAVAPTAVAGKALLYKPVPSGPQTLWLSDGTSAGTTKLKTIPLHPPSSAAPEFFSSFTIGSRPIFLFRIAILIQSCGKQMEQKPVRSSLQHSTLVLTNGQLLTIHSIFWLSEMQALASGNRMEAKQAHSVYVLFRRLMS